MQFTVFSFIMSLLCFNIYIVIINMLRKNDSFIISFSGLPLIYFLFLSIFRLIFNFEIPGSIVISSKVIFTRFYDFITMPLYLKGFTIEIYQLLIFIWALGTIILFTKTIKRYTLFKRNLGNLDNQQNRETAEILNKILIRKKMQKKIKIIQNNNISSPFILGIVKGIIYIPKINFSEEELEYIISHEINHFLKYDCFQKILVQSIKYIFWWNPFAHLFANNFNQILEIQCDLKTIANFSEEEKTKYLEIIAKIVRYDLKRNTENIKYVTAVNFVEIEELANLKQRFRIVLNYKPKTNKFKIFNIALYLVASFIFISSYFIVIQPTYNPPNDEAYTKEDNENNSFILEKSSGDYDIYINNAFKYNIKSLEDLDQDLIHLPILKRID